MSRKKNKIKNMKTMNKIRLQLPRLYLVSLLLSIFCNNLYAQKVITKNHFGSRVISEQYQVNQQGQRNGYYKSYNPDGILLYSYNFKNGQEHGLCIDYAGQRKGQNIYCYGKPLQERLMVNGNIQSEKYYGCANNTNFLFHTKKLISTDIYERVEYFENGKIKEKFNETSSYVKAKGQYEKNHENGKLAEKGMIDNGRIGNWIGYYESGDTLYFAKYDLGVEVLNKTYFEGNKIGFILSIDDQFENISKIYYHPNGKLKSVQNFKTYPFSYTCGSKDDPKTPQNWRQLAEQKIICGGKSYNPLDLNNNYLESEKTYNETGELVSDLFFVLREINGKQETFKKDDLEFEDSLWSNVQSNKSSESLDAYFKNSNLKLYYQDVSKIMRNTYDELKSEVDSMLEICEQNKCLSDYKLQQAKNDIRHNSITAINNLYEIKIVLNYLNNPPNLIDKETKKSIAKATNISDIKKLLGL
jgi:antitoxin component YwqK of YwqJK toxin-antitoxin module